MKVCRKICPALVLLASLCAVAASAAQNQAANQSSRHTLWKAEGKSGAMYLLGSVHVLKAEDYPLPRVMEEAFTNSEVFVFETDMAAMEDPQVQLKIMSKAQLPAGETLEQQLSPAVYALFTNHVHAAGLPMAMLDQFKPSLAAMTLAFIEMQKLGVSPEHGVDKHYFERARKAGKEIISLETVDFQVNLVTDFTREEAELLLKATLAEVDQTKNELGTLLKAWKVGDTATLEKLLNQASKDAPVIYKRMLTDRNARWVPKLEELLGGKKTSMVIVGAGHLVGPDGVPELLKKKGWKIIQL